MLEFLILHLEASTLHSYLRQPTKEFARSYGVDTSEQHLPRIFYIFLLVALAQVAAVKEKETVP